MPASRNMPSRRSRRLSKQEPRNYNDDLWESYDLLYPRAMNPNAMVYPHSENSSMSPPLLSYPSQPSPSSPPCDVPRTSHSRRRQKDHVSRPPNAFMLYRSDFWAQEKLKETPIERDHRDISRIAAHCWHQLGDEEKQKYKKLAEQRKEIHRLQHPDYKYAPTARKERSIAKRRVKKGNVEEEERCRKLATLVMGGLRPDGIREAMKKADRQSAPEPRAPAAQIAPIRNSPEASQVSPYETAPKVESPPVPELSSEPVGSIDIEFVPTDEIPPLDLSAAPRKPEINQNEFDLSIRPLAYDLIDCQFGYKAESAEFLPDSYTWYLSDGTYIGADSLAPSQPLEQLQYPEYNNSYIPDDPPAPSQPLEQLQYPEYNNSYIPDAITSPVVFTNPFTPTPAEIAETNALFEGQQGVYENHPSCSENPTFPNDEADMNLFFRFDQD
ncbi:hypothetical protein BD779DRAFT_490799 [Infundibulicybe gibba]|nr:hypothetical protein BD779DRAFT_490799 [Infundibulicybe gibba]